MGRAHQDTRWDIPAHQDRAHQWVVEYGREDIYRRLVNDVRKIGAHAALMKIYQHWELDAEINLWSCLAARAEREIAAEGGIIERGMFMT
jgi:hypothetical protein